MARKLTRSVAAAAARVWRTAVFLAVIAPARAAIGSARALASAARWVSGRLVEGWHVIAFSAGAIAALWVLAPHQLPILLWNTTQFTVGATAGYWVDRLFFPAARPGDLEGGWEQTQARYRRAALIGLGGLGLSLGV